MAERHDREAHSDLLAILPEPLVGAHPEDRSGQRKYTPSNPAYARNVMVSGRATVTAVVAAAAAVAGIWAVHHLNSDAPARHAAPANPPVRTAPLRTAPAPPAVSRDMPLRKPPPPHEYVPATAPKAFSYRGSGFTVQARVCGMNYVRPLDPPGEQHHTVCWVQHDFGYAPGSAGRGTTYLLGHAWAEDPAEVLNPVSQRATAQVLRRDHTRALDGVSVHPVTALNGDVITLRTATGMLRYGVRSAYAIDKSQAGSIASLMDAHVRNRVVVITCAELAGVDYDYNIVVNAFLITSRASRP